MTLISKNFSEVITFSRGTGATRVNSSGLIVGVDFSATSSTIATGSKTFTLAADANVNRDWPVNSNVIAVSQAGATGSMTGTVTSYTPSTQSLVINVTSVTGSGTSTDWRIGSLEMREDYDPVTLVRKGVLSEVSATNLLLNSEAGFLTTRTSGLGGSATAVTSADFINPMGSAKSVKFTPTGTTAYNLYRGSNGTADNLPVTSGVVYSRIIYFRKQSAAYSTSEANILIQFNGAGGFGNAASYLLSTLTETSPTFVGNGWHKLSSINTATASSVGDFMLVSYLNGATATGADSFYFCLSQTEASAYQTSYIPTTTAQVTRNADNFPLTAAALTSIRQGEGTLYAEIDCPDTGVAQKRAFRLSGTNADIRIGKQGTGTLSNFSKMAEGAGLRLMGTANSLIRGNGQDLVGVTATNDRLGTAAAIPVVNAVAFDGSNRFALASSSTGTSAVEEVFVDGLLGTFSGKGAGAFNLAGAHHNGSRFIIASVTSGSVFVSNDGASYRRINTTVLSQPAIEVTSGLVGATLRNVIVGNGGFIATSDDNGETWTARSSGVATTFTAVAYSPTTFVAVNDTAANSRYSLDGITYTAVTGLTGSVTDVVYTGSQYVAINSTGGVFTSANGQAFTAVTTSGITPAFTSAQGITFANGFYTIVGNNGQIAISQTAAAASPATWTTFVTAQTGTSQQLNEVVAFAGSFYAAGAGQTVIKFSQSLTPTFTSQTSNVGSILQGIAASGTTLLIAGTSGALASSTDGTTFTSRTNNNNALNGIAFGNNVFVSVGNAVNGSGYIATIAADGTVTRRVSGLSADLTGARFLGGNFYSGESSVGNRILRSTDAGASWALITVGGVGGVSINDFASNGTTLLAIGSSGISPTTTNGISRSTDNGATFSAFQQNGLGGVGAYVSIDHANNMFVAVGAGGKIVRSIDGGATFSQVSSGTTANLNSVMYSTRDQLWYAAGNGGVLLYSPDAITWTAVQNSGTASILGTTLQSNQPLPQFKSGVNKIALSYKANKVISALNGVASTTDTTATIPSITAGTIGENFNGTIQKIEVLDSALTTSEIIEKTL